MKNVLILILLISSNALAQIDIGIADGGKGVFFRQKPVGVEYLEVDFEPLFNKEPLPGKLYFGPNTKGLAFESGQFNIENQIISVVQNGNKLTFDPNTIYGFDLYEDGYQYRFVSLAVKTIRKFYEVLVENEKLSLLLSRKVIRKTDPVNPALGIKENDKLQLNYKFYLYKDKELILVTSRKNLLKILNSEELVNDYISSNKLDIDNVSEMMEFVKAYNKEEGN